MRTSAPVALWWNQGLLNHTVEPLKSLAEGSAQPSDQTEPATSDYSRAGGERGKGGGEGIADVLYLMQKKIHIVEVKRRQLENMSERRQREEGRCRQRSINVITALAKAYFSHLGLCPHILRLKIEPF